MNEPQNIIKTIGGYMELEIPKGFCKYPSLIALNTGRNALEYILRIKKYKTIYLPYFTCEVLLEPLRKLNIDYRYYKLHEDLDPIIDFELDEHSGFLYTNYFGIKTNTVERLSTSFKNLIIDNAQAFYSAPIKNVDTFYSCRKFFGVPDGSYIYTPHNIELNLKMDNSTSRFSHLIKSIDYGIESAYYDYLKNNEVLCNSDIKKMSRLTSQLLGAIDYNYCAKMRRNNFNYLHKYLEKINLLDINFVYDEVPMVYPLLLADSTIKEQLIQNKIFVATYWPNVFDWTDSDSYEYFLSKNLIALPIDHRYTPTDMRRILTVLNSLI